MTTLLEILTSFKQYDSSWAIYAEKIDGKFEPESRARFGQTVSENGGILDGCEFFSQNDLAQDSMDAYYGDFDLYENLSCNDELKLQELWKEAYPDEEIPSYIELSGWCLEVSRNLIDDVELHVVDECESLIDEVRERWHDNCDSEEAAINLIEQINQ